MSNTVKRRVNPLPADQYVDIGVCESTNVPMRICYNTFGDSANPCVLLVSGLGASLLVWEDPFCQMIADKGYYLIRYDNRDVGLSTHFDDFAPPKLLRFLLPKALSFGEGKPWYTLNDMAKDGMKLLTALGIEKAHVVGASMGGMIAQCMAIQFPERVLSLNIIYSHSGGPHVKSQPLKTSLAFLDGPKSSDFSDILDFKVRHRKRFLGNYSIPDEVLRQAAEKNLTRCEEDKAGLARQVWSIQRAESRDAKLKAITCPSIIFHGKLDTMIPYENGVALSKLIPNATFVTYPDMGHHMPEVLFADMVDKMIKNFISASEGQ